MAVPRLPAVLLQMDSGMQSGLQVYMSNNQYMLITTEHFQTPPSYKASEETQGQYVNLGGLSLVLYNTQPGKGYLGSKAEEIGSGYCQICSIE